MKKIMILDCCPLVLIGLEYTLSRAGFEVSDPIPPDDSFIYSLFINEPDILIIDPTKQTAPTLAKVGQYLQTSKETRLIIFSSYLSAWHISRSHHLFPDAFINKSECLSVVVSSLTGLLSTPDTFDTNPRVLREDDNCLSRLSNREMQVLNLIASGKKNKIIANIIGLNNKTVSTYKRKIMKKLNFGNERDLIDFTLRQGL
ncbi:helix-turn-helix transcriptional regulator [Candidatus Pantoea multigeneris]|uniref:Response regulator transcription factor n=1 Tax=Candidatus Pantoea multigeneris TaxID=2608357 RepID=A0ABX0RK36_9GAMM|nr:response regulator transcription factor [Pantoea multigeneris]NIF23759.1 response regulator transcription factor [Pantoea multigeneris]